MKRLLPPVALGMLLMTSVTAALAAIPLQIEIDTGIIAGTSETSSDVRVFRGIPYAAPPVGGNRWRAPQPAESWQGVRAATEFGPRCTQGGFGGSAPANPPPTDEDCLYLNVWTSAESAGNRHPVMLWLYGGGFFSGAGSEARYGGEGLAKKGAVVVTINYRLGSLGFLAHPELSKESGRNVSGNYGMLDAIAALRWVQRNIGAFGGDPSNVTVFGESAGANLTAALVGSPEAKGLFHRAIAQSGAWMGLGMARMGTLAQAEQIGAKAVADFGAKSIAELRAKPAAEVFSAIRGGGIVVDGYLVPEDLSITFAAGTQNAVDLLVGSNKDEGTFFARPGLIAEQFTAQASQRFGAMAANYLKFYPAGSDAQAAESYLAAFSDEAAWHMRRFAQVQARLDNKAFVYYFTRVPPSPPDRPSRGATHVAEISYMFDNLAPGQPWSDVDEKLADTMSSYWVNFATAGDPNGADLPSWPAFGATGGKAQVLGDTVTTESSTTPSAAKLAFFDAAYQQQMQGGTKQ